MIMQLETSTIFRIDPLQLSRLDLAQERVRCIHLRIVTHNKSCATFWILFHKWKFYFDEVHFDEETYYLEARNEL